MSESKQLFDKHEENVDSITGQRDAHLAGTAGNGSPRLQERKGLLQVS